MRPFGCTRTGLAATLWTLRAPGIEIDVTDFGATLVAVRVPDRRGSVDDVVLGFADVAGYESADNQYFGCTVGRVCNRIARSEFMLDGTVHRLARNEGNNHLHGGSARSFDKVLWRGESIDAVSSPAVRFVYFSADGEEGYPGNVEVGVEYRLLEGARLRITIEATSDRRTPYCATNHAYWNLAGAGAPTVLDHSLWIAADRHTPTDGELIPTGAIERVAGTALDFTAPRPIGARIHELLDTPARGYDHNFVLRAHGRDDTIAELRSAGSGRWMRIATSEPGLQVYSGNHLRGQRGKDGQVYAQRSGLCLETQHFPDSVHHAHFPSTILSPGVRHITETTWTFGSD